MNQKIDPIRDRYFEPLERAESWFERLLFLTAAVSLAVPVIDRSIYPTGYAVVQISFATLVVVDAILGLAIKLYWGPRGAERRISDFVSSAFGVSLSPERTQGYYNNTETEPVRRAALQLLENAWFTKEIARLMCVRRRFVVGIYAFLWIVAIVNRNTPVDLVSIGSQILFSEEIISSLVRLEWLRAKTERVFDSMFRQLSVSNSETPGFAASVVDFLARYENNKATSNVTLSSRVFNTNNARLSAEWNRIRSRLGA